MPALPTLPQEYVRPELMIIGDSLAQGCRSLSVQVGFCQQSWAARIATAQGWNFRTPDFPRPILFDLEQEIRLLGDVVQLAPADIRFKGMIGRFLQNLRAWLPKHRWHAPKRLRLRSRSVLGDDFAEPAKQRSGQTLRAKLYRRQSRTRRSAQVGFACRGAGRVPAIAPCGVYPRATATGDLGRCR